jgi:hypothetical protein
VVVEVHAAAVDQLAARPRAGRAAAGVSFAWRPGLCVV